MSIKTFEARIIINGIQQDITIQADDIHKARKLIEAQYAGCKIYNLRQKY